MKNYEIIETEEGIALKATEGEKTFWIPIDPSNSDYAEYLASLEGKEPNLPKVEEAPETPEAE